MREYIIDQLRERASVRGKQKTWVSAMNDEQLYELFLRLRNAESAKSIARYSQQAWSVNPDSSVHSISQGILKFKRRIAHLLLTQPPADVSSAPANELMASDQLEGLEGMERIAQLQLERIQRMIAEELETGVRHTSVSRELQALSTLMKCQMQLKEWDIMHEGNDPVKRRRLERMKRRYTRHFFNLMDFDDEGDRFVKAAQRLMEMVEEHAVEVEVDPDGKLYLVKTDESPNDNHTQ